MSARRKNPRGPQLQRRKKEEKLLHGKLEHASLQCESLCFLTFSPAFFLLAPSHNLHCCFSVALFCFLFHLFIRLFEWVRGGKFTVAQSTLTRSHRAVLLSLSLSLALCFPLFEGYIYLSTFFFCQAGSYGLVLRLLRLLILAAFPSCPSLFSRLFFVFFSGTTQLPTLCFFLFLYSRAFFSFPFCCVSYSCVLSDVSRRTSAYIRGKDAGKVDTWPGVE